MRTPLVLAVAAATGAAVLVVELMAVRLMAPWFGASQLVWTNVIGVVLAALAAGQWLGGRWAEGRGRPGPVALLVASGALSLALPDLVAAVAAWARPEGLQLDEAFPFVTSGSLLVAIVAVGLPMAALGAVTPWLVRLSRDAGRAPGRVAGAVLAAGTLGSLLGAFGSTHALLPWLGSAGAVRLAGGVLLLAALALASGGFARAPGGKDEGGGRSPPRDGRAALGWLLVPLATRLALPAPGPDPALLAAVETPYQSARIELDADGTRLLRINEGLDSFHSAWKPGELWTGRYFDAFVLPAAAAPPGPDGTRRVLVLGLGGGTMARQVLAVVPDAEVTGVELDPALVQLGRRWLDLPAAVRAIVGVDARVALHGLRGDWSAILVDAYAQQIYLPPHMCTREFFAEVRGRLAPGGAAALNLGGRTREDPVVAAVAAAFGEVFPQAEMARVPGTRNWIVIGWNGPTPGRDQLVATVAALGAGEELGWMTGDLFAPVPALVGRPLVDGDAPVEALAHAAWRAGS